ncbi:hypothetical protein J3Q64DRAFT_1753931 [Phycomyces blakesleeanus]|uniref:BHLH domain-containing protein n=2 Tax=Phycomyces blakesleeanus TaxID=4837 RepID=A0ABR3AVU4_PHYBL
MTPSQSASLEALHQSIQNAGMNPLSALTAVAQQHQQHQHQEHSSQEQASHTQQSPQPNSSRTDRDVNQDDSKPPVGSDEWHRIRRENHKQVERRRRETINDGINEIARIVPGCEKNKGSILQRAAAYIRQLKENEASTLEKWTLEKLLTDQAINELNRQVEVLKVELDRTRQDLSRQNEVLKAELERSHQEQQYIKREYEALEANTNKRQKSDIFGLPKDRNDSPRLAHAQVEKKSQ